MMGGLPFQFLDGPWENARRPTIVRENPTGGDPLIIVEIARVYNPNALYELCRLANSVQSSPPDVHPPTPR